MVAPLESVLYLMHLIRSPPCVLVWTEGNQGPTTVHVASAGDNSGGSVCKYPGGQPRLLWLRGLGGDNAAISENKESGGEDQRVISGFKGRVIPPGRSTAHPRLKDGQRVSRGAERVLWQERRWCWVSPIRRIPISFERWKSKLTYFAWHTLNRVLI